MGPRSARIFECGDAGRLIHVDAGRGARIYVGHAKDVVLRRIEVGVENAARPAELKLHACALADLQGGFAEMADQFLRSQAYQRRLALHWSNL